ncbi:MAG: hypothetical protein QOI98_2154, partial [Solirubrobacteraceae bacterium]|nr:hypothetical protein [Solirubrobacteraceae bacterium]
MRLSSLTYLSCLAAVTAIAVLAPSVASGANLVQDGSFEVPAFTGGYMTVTTPNSFGSWTVASGSIDRVSAPRWTSAKGSRSVDLNACGPGSIFQAVATVPGTS